MKPAYNRHRNRPTADYGEKYRMKLNGRHNAFLYSQILTLLASNSPGKDERISNSVMLAKFGETIERLAKLTPGELTAIADQLSGMVEIHIDMPALTELLLSKHNDNNKRDRHLNQCVWLIEHGASNTLILGLCATLVSADIKRVRIELGKPVPMGRSKTLELEQQLSVHESWKEICKGVTDTFRRYQLIQQAYPDYTVGQLHTAVMECTR